MLNNTKDLYGFKLAALDGDIGHVKDFYFDDQSWVIRYLVADTASWLTGRLVLLTPHSFGKLDPKEKSLHVKLHKEQIEHSPSIGSHLPVSRQYELEYYSYYGWPAYWEGDGMWGIGGFPVIPPLPQNTLMNHPPHRHRQEKHLQSAQAVTGYAIETTDGSIGRVSGLNVDDKSWAVREIVVEAGHWYAGKEILIAPGQVERISYEDSKVFVSLTKADIERTGEQEVVHASPSHATTQNPPTE